MALWRTDTSLSSHLNHAQSQCSFRSPRPAPLSLCRPNTVLFASLFTIISRPPGTHGLAANNPHKHDQLNTALFNELSTYRAEMSTQTDLRVKVRRGISRVADE